MKGPDMPKYMKYLKNGCVMPWNETEFAKGGYEPWTPIASTRRPPEPPPPPADPSPSDVAGAPDSTEPDPEAPVAKKRGRKAKARE